MSAQLSKVGVARNSNALSHVNRAVRLSILDVVTNLAFPNDISCPAIGKANAAIALLRKSRVFPQSGNRRHDLERGPRRVQAEARAIQQIRFRKRDFGAGLERGKLRLRRPRIT